MTNAGTKTKIFLFTLLLGSGLFLSAAAQAASNCFCYYSTTNDTGCIVADSSASKIGCKANCEGSRVGGKKNLSYTFVDPDNTEERQVEEETCKGFGEKTNADITETGVVKADSYLIPSLSIDIPGVNFSNIVEEGGVLHINFIADYIAGVYQYTLGAAAIIAVVMIMIGGVQYIIGSSAGSTDAAKKRITDATIGLVLIFGAYVMLSLVNPNLTELDQLNLAVVDPNYFVVNNYDSDGAITLDKLSEIDGIICPKNRGEATLSEIAQSFKGKVTYRFGGKGQGPTYSDDTDKVCENKQLCRDFCPDNTICLDCSGFVNVIKACAGLPADTKGTKNIFSDNAEKMETCTETTVNGEELQPGDLIGWRGDDVKNGESGYGHVYIYIGDGLVADSHGSGRPAGTAMGIYSFSSICNKFVPDIDWEDQVRPYKIVRTKVSASLDATEIDVGGGASFSAD